MSRLLGRRMFLQGAGSAALGIPLLTSLLPKEARAQSMAPPKRFIAMMSYSGQNCIHWYPTTTPPGYQLHDAVFPNSEKADGTTYLSQRIPGSTKYSWAPLADFAAAGISDTLTTALNPYLGKFSLLRGIDFLSGTGHNEGATFGNYAACTNQMINTLPQIPTIDQVLAYSSRFYPTQPAMRALHLGTGSPNSFSYTDYGMRGGAIEQAQCYLNPHDVWDQLFRDLNVEPMPRENPRRRLLNDIYADFTRLRDHRRLSAADKSTLDRHMSFLSDIESKLMMLPPQNGCQKPDEVQNIENGYPWGDVSDPEHIRTTVNLMIDLAVAALRCDLTRIVTFKVEKAMTDASGSWRGSFHNSADVQGDWHQFAHDAWSDPNSMSNLVALNRWIASEVFGGFMQRLDVEEANGKTYLDNSLLCWGNELGFEHYNVSIPTALAGGAGGAIQPGYYVDYIDWEQDYANPIDGGVLIPGLPHNRLMVTILQAMGLQPADYERDNTPGYGLTDQIETPYNWPRDYDLSLIGTPLPGIFIG